MNKLLHIAWSDQENDSAAIVLHKELLKKGLETELWVFEKKSRENNVYKIAENFSKKDLFTENSWQTILQGRKIEEFEAIHIHGLGENIAPALLNELGKAKQFFWSIEDCSPYTAGCSHSAHCQQWLKDCSTCPVCADQPAMQEIRKTLFLAKKEIYKNIHVTFLCQNIWQKEQLEKSIAGNQKAIVWNPMLDTNIFHPGNRKNTRMALGIPENAFVIMFPSDYLEGKEQIMPYLRSVLQAIRDQYSGYLILINWGKEALSGNWAVDEMRHIDNGADLCVRGLYGRAANVQLYFAGTDSSYFPVQEMGSCALPSIVFNIGAASTMISNDTGALIESFSEAQLATVLLDAMKNPAAFVKKGAACYALYQEQKKTVEEYIALYSGKENISVPDIAIDEILQCDDQIIASFLEKQTEKWNRKAAAAGSEKRKIEAEKNIFIDEFFSAWLTVLMKNRQPKIWALISLWLLVRQVQIGLQFISEREVNAHLVFCRNLRQALVQYFHHYTLKEFTEETKLQTSSIVKLWYFVFLNTEAIINRAADQFACPPEYLKEEGKTGYPLFFIQSMYEPHIKRPMDMTIKNIMTTELPVSLRVVVAFWLVSAPFFDGTVVEQQAVLCYIREMCAFMIEKPEYLSPGLRYMVMDKIMVSLWRLSYLGGNNIQTLQAYGDFLQFFAKQTYPAYVQPIKARKHHKNEPLRVGYISLNFRNQAVSQYMANRIKYHDKKKFFVKTFIVGRDKGDAMTQQIRDWSDSFEDITIVNFQEVEKIAEAVKKSELDLLIYADIGMNNMTYILGALRLAPIQAVLVGHGTTTGLTSIDYYISGDHEPENAQEHYTEKIIRLPFAGAAQLPPEQSAKVLTRKEFEIPEDAVLFISCANGLKHVASRDELLIRILQKAPNAYILLKPYLSPNTIDWKFRDRVLKKAVAAGVADRLKIIPPLPESGDLMALIKLADVQLDTFPYGGWTTNLEALYYHLPIVTQQGEMARSRWGAGLLLSMGIQEGIANNENEYVEWAVRFAKDENLRKFVAKCIEENVDDVLFSGENKQAGYEDHLLKIMHVKVK